MQMKYFIYCRKSSEQEDRQILSLPAQVKELTDLAEKDKLQVIDIFQESMSAHWAGRPKFNEMMARVRKGEANGVIVWDESRIARNAKDAGDVIYMLDLEQLVEIRKPNKTYKNTPDDKSWLAMCFMMSKKESDDKGVNIKRGMRQKAEQGWYPSPWTKPGYMWDRFTEKGKRTILNDPTRFPLIKECWDLMISGAYTVPQILNKLNNEWGYVSPTRKSIGGKPMGKSQLYTVFSDPFYYGWFEYKNSDGVKYWQKGSHDPMITEEEFNKVQIRLGRSCKQRMRKHEFPLTGILRCGECGAMVTAEEKWQIICSGCKHKFSSLNKTECPTCKLQVEEMINPKVLHYIYYHCTKRVNPNCKQKSVIYEGDHGLKDQADKLLKSVRISERFKNWAIKYLNSLNDEEISSHTATISLLQSSYSDCVKKLDNLVRLKISPQNSDGSLLSDDEFKAQKISIVAEKTKLEEKLGIQGDQIINWVDTVERTFDFAIHARYRFDIGSPEEKREILFTIGSNMKLFNQILIPNLEKEYSFLEAVTQQVPSTSYGFEPDKISSTPGQLEELWAKNITVIPG